MVRSDIIKGIPDEFQLPDRANFHFRLTCYFFIVYRLKYSYLFQRERNLATSLPVARLNTCCTQ